MRKWLHRALKGASLTTALFVFQACYGTPPSMDSDFPEEDPVALVEQTAVTESGTDAEVQEQTAGETVAE